LSEETQPDKMSDWSDRVLIIIIIIIRNLPITARQ